MDLWSIEHKLENFFICNPQFYIIGYVERANNDPSKVLTTNTVDNTTRR